MNMRQKLLEISMLSFLVFSCSPTAPVSKGSGGSQDKNLVGQNATGTNAATTGPVAGVQRKAPPNFQAGDIGNMNGIGVKSLSFKSPEDKDKIFLLQRISAYRSVWMNVTLKLSDVSPFWGFMKDVNTAVDATALSSFSHEAFPHGNDPQTDTVSMHQPIATEGGTDNLGVSVERGDQFHVIGHVLSQSLNYPDYPTGVLSLFQIGAQDPAANAISPPKTYRKLYSRLGPMTAEILDACTKVSDAAKKKESPDVALQAKCEEVTAGGQQLYNYTDVQYGGTTTTGVGNMSDFYQKQTLIVWEPMPFTGYVCLGVVATNTTDMPKTSADAGGPSALYQKTMVSDGNGGLVETYACNMVGQAGSSCDYPVWCVQQQYAVEGKLAAYASNGQVDFYRVVAKDDTGYGDANLMWAFPTETPAADRLATKVYVLNKKYVKILDDLNSAMTKSNTNSTGTGN